MPRPMSSAMLTAFGGSVLYPALFIEAHFVSGIVYAWSGIGSIAWNGHTWAGLGGLLGISVIDEGNRIEAKGTSLTLSGIEPDLLADVLQEFQVGAPCIITIGLFDGASPPALLADPLTAWAGNLDQPVIDVGGETATITVTAESELLLMDVPVGYRYTQDDLQAKTPGDLGCQFVVGIQDQLLYWGRVPAGINPI